MVEMLFAAGAEYERGVGRLTGRPARPTTNVANRVDRAKLVDRTSRQRGNINDGFVNCRLCYSFVVVKERCRSDAVHAMASAANGEPLFSTTTP